MNMLKHSAGLILLTTLLLILSAATADAQRGRGNVSGMGQEWVKPDIIELTGELVEIRTGPCEQTTGRAVIGTHLFIRNHTDGEIINIHLGDAKAVEPFVSGLIIGQKIYVDAFRTELLDEGHFIAVEIESAGRFLTLRQSDLRPFWAGSNRGRRGRW